MSNPYADVIGIITDLKDSDWKPLLVQVAKKRPTAVLEACELLGIKYPNLPSHEHALKFWFVPVCQEIADHSNSESTGKIHGIKKLRGLASLDLAKAKPIVEDIMEKCSDYIDKLKLQGNLS